MHNLKGKVATPSHDLISPNKEGERQSSKSVWGQCVHRLRGDGINKAAVTMTL